MVRFLSFTGRCIRSSGRGISRVCRQRIVLDATIQRFEFTFELFWKILKRVLSVDGIEAKSPKDVIKKAYQIGWLDDEDLWLNMMLDRNATSHIYDEEEAQKVYQRVREYYPVLRSVYRQLSQKLRRGVK